MSAAANPSPNDPVHFNSASLGSHFGHKLDRNKLAVAVVIVLSSWLRSARRTHLCLLPWRKAWQTQRKRQDRASDLSPSFSVTVLSWHHLHFPSAAWGTSEDHGVVGQFSGCFPRKMGRKLGKLYPPPSFRWLRLTRSPWIVYLFSPTSFLSHPDPTLRVTREDVKREIITSCLFSIFRLAFHFRIHNWVLKA